MLKIGFLGILFGYPVVSKKRDRILVIAETLAGG